MAPIRGPHLDDRRELSGIDRVASLVGDDLDAVHELQSAGIRDTLIGEVIETETQTATAEQRRGHDIRS